MTHRELKSLVRKFLREIRHVPFRAVDCDQDAVDELRSRLRKAAGAARKRRAAVRS